MTHLQHRLNAWVAFAVLPMFAIANAGIPVVDILGDAVGSRVGRGVMLGLAIGKPVRIRLFAWIAVRYGVAIRPPAFQWGHLTGVALLGGIGFTMSLFVPELAFETGAAADEAQVGILIASIATGLAGYLVLHATLPPASTEGGR